MLSRLAIAPTTPIAVFTGLSSDAAVELSVQVFVQPAASNAVRASFYGTGAEPESRHHTKNAGQLWTAQKLLSKDHMRLSNGASSA